MSDKRKYHKHPAHPSFAHSVGRIAFWMIVGVASFMAIVLGAFGSDLVRWFS